MPYLGGLPDTKDAKEGKSYGVLAAVDVATGKVAWRYRDPFPLGGGTLSTAGGVIFTGNLSGDALAFDAKTGKELWRFRMGGGVRSQPIAYQLDGRTYVAIASGSFSALTRSWAVREHDRGRHALRLRPAEGDSARSDGAPHHRLGCASLAPPPPSHRPSPSRDPAAVGAASLFIGTCGATATAFTTARGTSGSLRLFVEERRQRRGDLPQHFERHRRHAHGRLQGRAARRRRGHLEAGRVPARGLHLREDRAMTAERWQVGELTITSVVEEQTDHIPAKLLFPEASAADIVRHAWLVPDFADASGKISMRVQAFVIQTRTRRVLVDPCVGNAKKRVMPLWNERTYPFMERLAQAGFDPRAIDTVVHTHLHADHVGWDTQLVAGEWVPTFVNARHLYTARELDYCRKDGDPGVAGVYADSVAPILAAGLADVVDEDADLGDGLRLEPSSGHTPGHVSLWLESAGETALISGDFLHHPVQCAEPALAEIGDQDPDQARATRRRLLARVSESGALFLGTHFGTRPAGRVEVCGDAWRFVPLAREQR
jgi:glyoxylase-like metal-dependent hydrolase (beta-lactamase superfamily II)